MYICYRCGTVDFTDKKYIYLYKGREAYCSTRCLVQHFVYKLGIEKVNPHVQEKPSIDVNELHVRAKEVNYDG